MKKYCFQSSPNDVSSTVRMSKELRDTLRGLAEKSGRSLNKEIVYRLVFALCYHSDVLHTIDLDNLVNEQKLSEGHYVSI